MTVAAGRANALVLSLSTLAAALFVAVQAWYARVAFVEASETRLLEDKLDLCFQNFDAAGHSTPLCAWPLRAPGSTSNGRRGSWSRTPTAWPDCSRTWCR
jgi:hypothetical protein